MCKMPDGLTRLYLLFLLVLGAYGCEGQHLPGPPAAKGNLIFTELMPPQFPGGSYWIEMYNPSDASRDIGACSLSGGAGQIAPLVRIPPVQPGKHVILFYEAGDRALLPGLSDIPEVFNLPGSFGAMPSGKFGLSCNGELIDEFSYGTREVETATSDGFARSWQRHFAKQGEADYESSDTWCQTIALEELELSDKHFATPGAYNTVCLSTMPFVAFDDQSAVLIENIDLSATLRVAEAEFERALSTSELVIWGIRDQEITPSIARKVSDLYFANIEMLYGTSTFTVIDWNHAVWHFAWAISNMYRNGNEDVRRELLRAYEDALTRPETLERYRYIAREYIQGERVVMGDIHPPAHNRMQQLIVAPGNPAYLQSYEEYSDKVRSNLELTLIHYLYSTAAFISDILE